MRERNWKPIPVISVLMLTSLLVLPSAAYAQDPESIQALLQGRLSERLFPVEVLVMMKTTVEETRAILQPELNEPGLQPEITVIAGSEYAYRLAHSPLDSHSRDDLTEEAPEMAEFETKRLPVNRDAVAPDGSDVRVLLQLARGSLAHFELAPKQTSIAVAHKTIEEIWYFLSGRGEMWRKLGDQEEVVPVDPGVSITIPTGTHFQFRSFGYEPLSAIGITMPPWPGEAESYDVEGPWTATVGKSG